MSYSHIPQGLQTVSPYFTVEHPHSFIEFLEKAFDAEQVYIHEEDSRVIHARIRIGTSLIELSEANDKFPARQFACQLFVPNADEVYEKAFEAGATSLSLPADMEYGLRAATVRDAWGNNWYISTQIKDKYSPEYWQAETTEAVEA